jgi:hypothetical protein
METQFELVADTVDSSTWAVQHKPCLGVFRLDRLSRHIVRGLQDVDFIVRRCRVRLVIATQWTPTTYVDTMGQDCRCAHRGARVGIWVGRAWAVVEVASASQDRRCGVEETLTLMSWLFMSILFGCSMMERDGIISRVGGAVRAAKEQTKAVSIYDRALFGMGG